MMTLYHCRDTRSFRVLWALEEIGLTYELKMLPFPPRVHAKEYLHVNPLGTVPYFIDGPTCMTESTAICHYLAERYGSDDLKVPTHDDAFASYLNGLLFGEATLTFPQTIVLRYGRLEPPERRLPQAAHDYTRWFLARARAIDGIVSQQDFYCAGRFTMADISVGYALMLADEIGLSAELSTATRAYMGRLASRAGYCAAKAAQERAPQWLKPVRI